MISLQNLHINSKAYILANDLKSFRPKCICIVYMFWRPPEVFSWLSDNTLIFRVRESAYKAMAKMERKGVIYSANGQ